MVRPEDGDLLLYTHDHLYPSRVPHDFFFSIPCDELHPLLLCSVATGRFVARDEETFKRFVELQSQRLRITLQEAGHEAVFELRTNCHRVYADGTAVFEFLETDGPVWRFQGHGVDLAVDYFQSVMWDPKRHSSRRARNGMTPSYCDSDPCSREARKGWRTDCPSFFLLLDVEEMPPPPPGTPGPSPDQMVALLDRRNRVFDYFERHRTELAGILQTDAAYSDPNEEADWQEVHGARAFLEEYVRTHKYFTYEFSGWQQPWTMWYERMQQAFLRDSVPATNQEKEAPRLSRYGKGLLNNARRDGMQRLLKARKGGRI